MANKRAPTRARKASRAATLLSLAPPGHSRRGSVPGHSRKTRSVPAGVHRPLPGPAKTLSPLGLVSPALPPAPLGQPTRAVGQAWRPGCADEAARQAGGSLGVQCGLVAAAPPPLSPSQRALCHTCGAPSQCVAAHLHILEAPLPKQLDLRGEGRHVCRPGSSPRPCCRRQWRVSGGVGDACE